MEIKIKCGGSGPTTEIINKGTGEKIRGGRVLNLHVDCYGLATATIEFANVEFEGDCIVKDVTELGDKYQKEFTKMHDEAVNVHE